MISNNKRCSCCEETKPTSEFNKRARSIDGLQVRCRDCNKSYAKQYNKEYLPNRRSGDPSLTGSRLYNIWSGMKDRCLNPDNSHYDSYGGRGISVCDEWLTWEGFKEGMLRGYKPTLSIERIDVNGNYCPENCEWIPLTDQALNRRDTVYITDINGESVSLTRRARALGLSEVAVYERYKKYGDDYYELFVKEIKRQPRHKKEHIALIAKYVDLPITSIIAKIEQSVGVRFHYQYVNQTRSEWKSGNSRSVLAKIVGGYSNYTPEEAN